MTSFKEARDFLLTHRTDYDTAYKGFRWPDPVPFNWALDWFDAEFAGDPDSRNRTALWIVDTATGTETKLSFAEMSVRSNQVANHLRSLGLKRGERLLLVLGNVPALWETMLAAIKLGAVVIPAATMLTAEELADRLDRGRTHVIVAGAEQTRLFEGVNMEGMVRLVTGSDVPGWLSYEAAFAAEAIFTPDGATQADDPLLLYFTSGTTAKPKLVHHTQRSYPVGALSTMYWLGLQPGDIHLNVSSPGWAKHAWSSFFAPWNAGATVFVCNQPRFSASVLQGVMARCRVTTLCAPPTVWRMVIQDEMRGHEFSLREACAAGEPLNPEIIERVHQAWGVSIRDGYGQTETTAQIANTPGRVARPGAMGHPLPGYRIEIVDGDDQPAREGQVCIACGGDLRPAGLMQGYQDPFGEVTSIDGAFYRTGDVAFWNDDGSLTFVGRADDVFKSSGYRISPFELESVLIEHAAVAEAAVVPAPDAVRASIPKAYVALAAGVAPDRDTALAIFRFTNARLAPYKHLRAITFVSELPKTISGKIRRVQLRRIEQEGRAGASSGGAVFAQSDFPELRRHDSGTSERNRSRTSQPQPERRPRGGAGKETDAGAPWTHRDPP